MKINNNDASGEPRIELVPLIDVIFCVLTFFLLAGLQVARQQAINIDIPSAKTATPQERELLMVSLNDQGQIFIEQQPVPSAEQLIITIKQFQQVKPNSSIVLYASKQVSYNQVIQVLDLLRSVAGERVALATVPGSPPPSTPTSTITPTPSFRPTIVPTVPLTPPNFPPNQGVTPNPTNSR
jgi:biopolymer transport protein ExbD